MRVRIAYTIEVPDEYRRAIRAHYGRDGMATREEVQQWYRSMGEQADDDLAMLADDERTRHDAAGMENR